MPVDVEPADGFHRGQGIIDGQRLLITRAYYVNFSGKEVEVRRHRHDLDSVNKRERSWRRDEANANRLFLYGGERELLKEVGSVKRASCQRRAEVVDEGVATVHGDGKEGGGGVEAAGVGGRVEVEADEHGAGGGNRDFVGESGSREASCHVRYLRGIVLSSGGGGKGRLERMRGHEG